LRPRFVENGGVRKEELEEAFRQAVAKHQARDFAGARVLLGEILAAFPEHPDVNFRMGAAYYEEAAYAEAAPYLLKALRARPEDASIGLTLAMALKALKNYGNAEKVFLHFIGLPDSDPRAAFAAFNLAEMYFEGGYLDKARELCLPSLARFRNDSAFQFLFGQVSLALKNYDDAIAAFDGAAREEKYRSRALVAAAPAFSAKKDCTGFLRRAMPEVERSSDVDLMIAAANFQKTAGNADEAMRLQAAALEKRPDDYRLHSYQIKSMTESDAVSDRQLYEYSLEWDRKFGTPSNPPAFDSWLNGPLDGRRIRVAVLSRTFRRHVTMTILRPLLPELAKRMELYGYYDDDKEDAFTAEARRSFAVWRNTSAFTEADAAKLIHDDAPDVLLDISGHLSNARTKILTYRPAPVQFTFADNSSSLGLKCVQYRFSDDIVEPQEWGDPYSSEKIFRLPNGFFLYQPLEELPAPGPCPSDKNHFVTFGSCTALCKITPTTLRLWKSVLDAVPDSVFILARDEFENDAELRDIWMHRFAGAGFPTDRCRIETGTKEDFVRLRFYDKIDISLDAFPYSGVTTTLDSLWMGVPVVNYREKRYINRIGSSFLSRVGLSDLVADQFEDFALVAARLASDDLRRHKLRRNLRETLRLSPICDPSGLASGMENAFRVVLGVS
jgi:predicted O-linked N-acetylglucosamine transferase (SPINDLY family)